MAFVRWRGNCAQLLTTITVDGRPRHRLLANLHGGFATMPTLWGYTSAGDALTDDAMQCRRQGPLVRCAREK